MEILDKLIDKAKKVCQQAEVFWVTSQNTDASFEANRLKAVETHEGRYLGLRIVKDGRIGYSTTNKIDDIDDILSMALEVSKFGAKAEFELPSAQDYPKVEVYDDAVNQVSIDQMVDLGNNMITAVRDHNPEVICEAGVTRNKIAVELLNSNGGHASYNKTSFSLGVEGLLTRGTDMLFVGDHESSCHPILGVDNIIKTTLEQLERAKQTVPSIEGQLPVVFTPRGVAIALISPLVIAFNGKNIVQGSSPLVGKLGEQIYTEELSVYDDATIDYKPGCRICDDEGIPSRKTALIEKGVVSSFLYDLQTAGLAKTQSTGSANRGGGLPSPSSSTLVIAEGKTSIDDAVADMKQGLIIEILMGAGQGNTLGGEFSGNVLLGYKVENGRIVGRVKDTMLSGNIYDIAKNGLAIGNKAEWVGGSLQTPSIYCPKLSVTTQK
ncbi:MAG: TldD/PmbA family protein [Chloroflexi bacterium]|jgi:PmbA protein|nr:TldD/PmbA family protein [Chloroflexota bacterium]MBT7080574.1 TldD/PmbA family protein [Chloroflexota bacterium]MBT7290836.1 TldD/PmbA family protein [Chloroflexota bacterium]